MTVRERIIDALLPVLREYVPELTGKELLFFGTAADIASPVPLKYGLDMTEEIVYNVKMSSKLGGTELIEGVRQENGFWSFTVSYGAMELLSREAARSLTRLTPCPVIPLGLTPEHIHARLLSIAERGENLVPSPEARRALWLTLTADPAANRGIILRAVESALDAARKAPSSAIGAEAALAMAACIEKMI